MLILGREGTHHPASGMEGKEGGHALLFHLEQMTARVHRRMSVRRTDTGLPDGKWMWRVSPPSWARRRSTRRGTIGTSRGLGAAHSVVTRTSSARTGSCAWSRCAPREVRRRGVGWARLGSRTGLARVAAGARRAAGRTTRRAAQHAVVITVYRRLAVEVCRLHAAMHNLNHAAYGLLTVDSLWWRHNY